MAGLSDKMSYIIKHVHTWALSQVTAPVAWSLPYSQGHSNIAHRKLAGRCGHSGHLQSPSSYLLTNKQAPYHKESTMIREQFSFINFFEIFLMKYEIPGSTVKANISSQNFMSLHSE